MLVKYLIKRKNESMEEHNLEAFCPRFHEAVELVGRRWTGVILRALFSGAERFSDLAATVPGMSDRLLSERLKELEAADIVQRVVIPATPVRVEYHLTAKGRALRPVVDALATWAEEWLPFPEGDLAELAAHS